jgi:hypothetical protein
MPSLRRLPKDIQLIIDEMLHPIDKMMIRITCRTKHNITVGIEDAKYILSNRQFTQFEYLRDQINHNIHRRRLILIAIQSGIPAIEYLGITVYEIKVHEIRLEECDTRQVAEYLHSRGLNINDDKYFTMCFAVAKHGNIELYDWCCQTFGIKESFYLPSFKFPAHMLDYIMSNGHINIRAKPHKFIYSVDHLNVVIKHGMTIPPNKLVEQAIKTCDHGLYITAGLGDVSTSDRLINFIRKYNKCDKHGILCNIVFSYTSYNDIPDVAWDYLMLHDSHCDVINCPEQLCYICNTMIDIILKHGDLQLCRWLFSKYTLSDKQKQRIIDMHNKWPFVMHHH